MPKLWCLYQGTCGRPSRSLLLLVRGPPAHFHPMYVRVVLSWDEAFAHDSHRTVLTHTTSGRTLLTALTDLEPVLEPLLGADAALDFISILYAASQVLHLPSRPCLSKIPPQMFGSDSFWEDGRSWGDFNFPVCRPVRHTGMQDLVRHRKAGMRKEGALIMFDMVERLSLQSSRLLLYIYIVVVVVLLVVRCGIMSREESWGNMPYIRSSNKVQVLLHDVLPVQGMIHFLSHNGMLPLWFSVQDSFSRSTYVALQ